MVQNHIGCKCEILPPIQWKGVTGNLPTERARSKNQTLKKVTERKFWVVEIIWKEKSCNGTKYRNSWTFSAWNSVHFLGHFDSIRGVEKLLSVHSTIVMQIQDYLSSNTFWKSTHFGQENGQSIFLCCPSNRHAGRGNNRYTLLKQYFLHKI